MERFGSSNLEFQPLGVPPSGHDHTVNDFQPGRKDAGVGSLKQDGLCPRGVDRRTA